MPDSHGPIDPDAILNKPFASVKRGYDPLEVQSFLMALAAELRAARERERELERAVEDAERRYQEVSEPSPSRLTALLGEETARVLDAANAAAAEIRTKAEETVARLLRDTEAEVARRRAEADEIFATRTAEAKSAVDDIRREVEGLLEKARADAEAEVESGRQRGREMVAEAQQVRERMLRDLARRRKALRQQIEQLQTGRSRLVAAYEVVRRKLDEVNAELAASLPDVQLAADAAGLRAGGGTGDEGIDRELAKLADEVELELDVEVTNGGTSVDERAEPAERVPAPELEEDEAGAASPGASDAVDEEGPTAAEAHEPAGPRAPDPTEGRKSSAVKIVRSEPSTEPPAQAAAEPEGRSAAKVAGLFARIKQEATQPDEGTGAVAGTPAGEAAQSQATEGEAPDQPVTDVGRRDQAVAELERGLARRIKRELAEEQNEMLDLARREKAVPAADAMLPASDAHLARYVDAATPLLVAAVEAGAAFVAPDRRGGPAANPAVDDLTSALAADVVGPLRGRLERVFASTADEPDDFADSVRSCYRECKNQGIEESAAHAVLVAFNRGFLDALAEGTKLHWVVDDGATESTACNDNASAGNLVKGEKFPSGHVAPPAHPTCRCVVVPVSP